MTATMMRRGLIGLAAALNLAIMLAEARPSAAQSAASQAAAPGLIRQIGLAELGFEGGVRLEGLGASREIFFPVPRRIAPVAARLRLSVESHSIFSGRRGLEVLANGQRLLTRQLPDGGARLDIDVELAPEHLDLEAGFLRLVVRTTGALTDNRCLDTRLAGEQVVLLPTTALELQLSPGAPLGVAELVRILPRDVAVVTRSGPVPPPEAAAALSAAHALAATGRHVRFGSDAASAAGQEDRVWRHGAVLVDAAGAGEDALAVRWVGGVPAIALSGPSPERAARLLAQGWRPVAQAGAVAGWAARGQPQAHAAPSQTRDIPLSMLRGDLSPQDIVERGTWTVDFAARDLPSGTRAAALALDIAAAPDSAGERPVAAVFLNEVLIGSTTLGTASPERMRLAIPAGLAGLENRLRVVLQRRPRGGECETLPVALPAQLLPSSTLLLAETSDAPADFFELAPRLGDGVAVLFDGAPDGAALSAALAVLGPQLRPGTPIAVRAAREAASGPFLAVTAAPPAGVASTPVRFDRGRMVLSDREGRTLLDTDAGAAGPVAQLVTAGAVPGIWLRPGAGASVPAVLRLDRGNVAFADASGVAMAWSAGRDGLVRVRYPDETDLLALLGRYRPWIVGALWLGVTALILAGVAQRWRRRSQDGAA